MSMASPHTPLDPVKTAADITRNSASNLWFVGQALSVERRRLFEASYATMRLIDDFVDDDFLARSEAQRAEGRRGAASRVKMWCQACCAAIAGSSIQESGGDRAEEAVLQALCKAAEGSDLPDAPWRSLADAMLFDVAESPLRTWADFESYCEGATVAPAAIFLYVLQANVTDSTLQAGLSGAVLADQARDMAVFCYLVHIVRDFAKDNEKGGQLVTIPADAFAVHDLERASLQEDPAMALPLLQDLVQRADGHRRKARAMADALIPSMGKGEGRILDALLSIYERLHDGLLEDPDPRVDRSSITAKLRASLVAGLGLG